MCVKEVFVCVHLCRTAEELLMPKPPGYFLIRVSETRIGYTLSLRCVFVGLEELCAALHTHTVQSPALLHFFVLPPSVEDRCRHFMVDVLEDGQYIIVGEDRRHRFLQDLVDFHRRTPIIPFYQVLTVACGQVRKCWTSSLPKTLVFV